MGNVALADLVARHAAVVGHEIQRHVRRALAGHGTDGARGVAGEGAGPPVQARALLERPHFDLDGADGGGQNAADYARER